MQDFLCIVVLLGCLGVVIHLASKLGDRMDDDDS